MTNAFWRHRLRHRRSSQHVQGIPAGQRNGRHAVEAPEGLPRRTGSLCPECLKVIPATLYIGDGALKMKKTCKEHGEFDEVCWSDAEMYLRAENWASDGAGLQNPQIVEPKECPYDWGPCHRPYPAPSP